MLKREDWQALQALLNDASKQRQRPPLDENLVRLIAHLRSIPSCPSPNKNQA